MERPVEYVSDLGRLDPLKEGLDQCQRLTEELLQSVDGLEARLGAMESTMLPLHRQTRELKVAQRNIEDTIDLVVDLNRHVVAVQLQEEHVSVEALHRDRQRYMDHVGEMKQALEFYLQNPGVYQSAKAVKHLKSMYQKACKIIEAELSSRLSDSFKPIRLPIRDDFVPVPEERLEAFAVIARGIDMSGGTRGLEIYIEKRSHILKVSILSMIESSVRKNEGKSLVSKSTPKFFPKNARRTAAKAVRNLTKRPKDNFLADYHEGSAPYIELFSSLLTLLKRERESLSKYAKLLSKELLDTDFLKLVDESIVAFSKSSADLWKKCHDGKSNMVLILLDILDRCDQRVPEYQELLGTGSTRIVDMMNRVRSSALRAIDDKIEAILEHNTKDVPHGGGYAQQVIKTISFLGMFLRYSSVIDQLEETRSSSPNTSLSPAAKSPRFALDGEKERNMEIDAARAKKFHGRIAARFIIALVQNLIQKSKSYRDHAKANLFLLNNFHYIGKNSGPLEVALDGTNTIETMHRCYHVFREAYREATWKKVSMLIDLTYCRDLVSKVDSKAELGYNIKKSIKNKFAGFNEAFDDIFAAQKKFSVPDSDVKSQLRNENVELIVPMYKLFLKLFGNLEFTNHRGRYIRYRANVLEELLNKFFEND